MILFVLVLGICSLLSQWNLLQLLAEKSKHLQQNCAEHFPLNFHHRELAASFVCGTAISDPFAHEIFTQTSLIHLMVVSGGHLLLLSAIYGFFVPMRFKNNLLLRFFLWLTLAAYCLMSGLQPPVLRAFVAFNLRLASDYFRWNWDGGKIILATGLFLLGLAPDWIHSFSLYLCWWAALGFLLAPLCLKKPMVSTFFSVRENRLRQWRFRCRQRLLSGVAVQSLMAFCFFNFSLIGVLMNAFVAPMISLVLFPLSVLSLLSPFFIPLTDRGWDLLLSFMQTILNFLANSFGLEAASNSIDFSSLPWGFLWLSLALGHCFFEWLRHFRYRASHV